MCSLVETEAKVVLRGLAVETSASYPLPLMSTRAGESELEKGAAESVGYKEVSGSPRALVMTTHFESCATSDLPSVPRSAPPASRAHDLHPSIASPAFASRQ